MTWQHDVVNLAFFIVLGTAVLIALGGGNWLWFHVTGQPYYTEFQPYDGNYCLDKTGWPWGSPPGYLYRTQVPMVSAFDDADQSGPQRMLDVEQINQSAWIPFSQWPSCVQYGEVL